MRTLFCVVLMSFFLGYCSTQNNDYQQAENSINAVDIKNHVIKISSDEFQGRMPCTPGEAKTVNYLKEEFIKLGLKPAFNGSYFQEVPLVQVKTEPSEYFHITGNKVAFDLKRDEEFVAWSMQLTDLINIDKSELVFAGYGIVAPEYQWDDYKGMDVNGKTVIVIVNDPGFATGDTTLFKGKTMTYYGRWTYKFEEASRHGAKGCLIIHQDDGAGYNFSIPRNSANSAKFYLRPEDNYLSRCAMEGWITIDAARKLFSNLGFDFNSLMKSAAHHGFKAIPLNGSVSLSIKSKHRFSITKNVGAVFEGTTRKDECIVYSGHWDHFGIGPRIDGDSIYNGAVDNGTTLAWMLEIAEAFTKLKNKPLRSVLFLAPSAEEQGLLGSAYYVKHPVFTVNKTVANINNDMMLALGRMKDLMVTGFGQSELDDYLVEAVKLQDRYIFPDPNSHKGMYFRSDHFSFAKAGIPSLFARGNCDSREHGKAWAANMEKEYLENNYHKPSDEYKDNWNFDGIVEDSKLLFNIGYKLVMQSNFPKWQTGSEFKSVREKTGK